MALKIKAKGKDAQDLLDKISGDNASGPAGIKGKTPMKPYPATMQSEGSNKTEENDDAGVTRKVKPTLTIAGSPEQTPVQGYNTVKKVARQFPADGPEAARKTNNMARDSRTNLGRATWSTPVMD